MSAPPPERRSGPPPQEAAAANHTNTDEFTAHRCQRCRRGLRAPQSVARSHGPVCWHRRYDAAVRLARLDCGCADPWTCRCTDPPLTQRAVDGYRDAARYVMDTTGCTPLIPVEVLRALFRRGGGDRALAEQLHAAVGGVIA